MYSDVVEDNVRWKKSLYSARLTAGCREVQLVRHQHEEAGKVFPQTGTMGLGWPV